MAVWMLVVCEVAMQFLVSQDCQLLGGAANERGIDLRFEWRDSRTRDISSD